MQTMLAAIDIGNTCSGVAVFADNRIVYRKKTTTPKKKPDGLAALLLSDVSIPRLSGIMVSSVVPSLDEQLQRELKDLTGIEPVFIDSLMKMEISLAVAQPDEVGADRIADVAGALEFFDPPCIVIDSGTATTFDILDENKNYLGGVIMPGIEISIRALAQYAAKLEEIEFYVPESIMADNTADCIRAGIFYSGIGGIQHLIAEYKKILGPGARVVATGGMNRVFRNHLKGVDLFEPDLIYFGLKRLYGFQKQVRSEREKARKNGI